MNDREMTKLAAKAAGNEVWTDADGNLYTGAPERQWNPLVDDADALRLAAALGFSIHVLDLAMSVSQHGGTGYLGGWMPRGLDDAADYRRAIVNGAAAIGRSM